MVFIFEGSFEFADIHELSWLRLQLEIKFHEYILYLVKNQALRSLSEERAKVILTLLLLLNRYILLDLLLS